MDEPSRIAYILLEREETALAKLDVMEQQRQFDRIVVMCAHAELEEGKSGAVIRLQKLAQRIVKFKISEFQSCGESRDRKDSVALEQRERTASATERKRGA